VAEPDDAKRHVDVLGEHSTEVRRASRELRDLSKRILAAVDTLRNLEAQSRTLALGSTEFHLKSAEIADQAKLIFSMAAEQHSLSETVPPQRESLEDLDEAAG
jgi:hypothetical protein